MFQDHSLSGQHDITRAIDLIALLAYALLRNGAFERARALYGALQLLRPGDLTASCGLAWAALEDHQPDVALTALDATAGTSRLSLLLRARALSQLGGVAEAQVLMAQFLALRTTAGAVQ